MYTNMYYVRYVWLENEIFSLLAVSVSQIEWYEEDRRFAIAFTDGLIYMGLKDNDHVPVIIEAHRVRTNIQTGGRNRGTEPGNGTGERNWGTETGNGTEERNRGTEPGNRTGERN